MQKLAAVIFESEARAEEVREKLSELNKEYLIELGDAAIAVKTDKGVKLNQLFSTTGAGAATGTLWGLLIGLLFFAPFAGAIAGLAGGALGGYLSDVGVDDKFMKELGGNMKEGEAALFILFANATEDKVLERIQGMGGTVLKTSLNADAEEKLRAALAA